MSKKGSITTASSLDFDRTLNRFKKVLKEDKNYKIAFLGIVGINTGLRITDLKQLRHFHFRNGFVELSEKKTSKTRKITFNNHINEAYQIFCNKLSGSITEKHDNNFVFISQMGSQYSIQQVNRELKKILHNEKKAYPQSSLRISSHTLRKVFGKKAYELTNLATVSEIFRHSSESVTRRYIGLEEEQIQEVYLML